MKNQVTFVHLLTIVSVLIIPLIIWGVDVESRFQQVIYNKKGVKENTINIKSDRIQMQKNHEEQMRATHRIELLLTNKADRK